MHSTTPCGILGNSINVPPRMQHEKEEGKDRKKKQVPRGASVSPRKRACHHRTPIKKLPSSIQRTLLPAEEKDDDDDDDFVLVAPSIVLGTGSGIHNSFFLKPRLSSRSYYQDQNHLFYSEGSTTTSTSARSTNSQCGHYHHHPVQRLPARSSYSALYLDDSCPTPPPVSRAVAHPASLIPISCSASSLDDQGGDDYRPHPSTPHPTSGCDLLRDQTPSNDIVVVPHLPLLPLLNHHHYHHEEALGGIYTPGSTPRRLKLPFLSRRPLPVTGSSSRLSTNNENLPLFPMLL